MSEPVRRTAGAAAGTKPTASESTETNRKEAEKTPRKETKTAVKKAAAEKKPAKTAAKKPAAKTAAKKTAAKTAAKKPAAKTTAKKPAAKTAAKKSSVKTAPKESTARTTAKKTAAASAAKKTTAAKKSSASAAKEQDLAKKSAAPAVQTAGVPKNIAGEPKSLVKNERPDAPAKIEPKDPSKAVPAVKETGSKAPDKGPAAGAAENKATEKAKAAPAKPAAPDVLKILFVTPEAAPFSATGGLGEVSGSLPAALNRLGGKPAIDCRVITPLYEKIDPETRARMKYLGSKYIPVAWRQKYMGVFELKQNGVTYYFIDNEEYFKREGLYGYFDDCERFAFFSRAVFESIEFTGFEPNIMHANDWQTALVPVYQDAIYHRAFMTTIFTIHNIEYQGHYGSECIHDVIGLPEGAEHLIEFCGDCNLMKGGIDTANLVTTVSPTYAQELKDPFYAYGLEGVIQRSDAKLVGILNGIDTAAYDPANDPAIAARYSSAQPAAKAECRRALRSELGLPDKDVPLMILISRLVPAKGIDLVCDIIDRTLDETGAQFIALGTGYGMYEDFFRGLQDRHPDQARALIQFNRALSHRMYAGADILLMPSKGEPCGLSQMIACRYGTVPIVRATGGLRDSVHDCTLGDGNGFIFEDYSGGALREAIGRAVRLYADKEHWADLVQYDMSLDFSWAHSSETYRDLYIRAAFK